MYHTYRTKIMTFMATDISRGKSDHSVVSPNDSSFSSKLKKGTRFLSIYKSCTLPTSCRKYCLSVKNK